MWKLNVAVASIMLVLLVYGFIINSKDYQRIRETNIRFKFNKQKDNLSQIVNEDGEQMKTPFKELAMPLLASGGAQKSRKQSLLFSHFPKAGGSEIKHILTTVVGESINVDQNSGMYKINSTILEDNYFLQTEFVPLEPYQKSNFFVIGHVRSPCNYLLSLWAFGSDGKGAFYHLTKDKSVYGNTPPYNNKDDLKRFTMWLQDYKETYTYRLVHKYFKNSIWKTDPTLSNADCWVYSEMLIYDLVNCLKRYEKQGGKVKWEKFHKIEVNENPSTHSKCEDYFGDGRKALVMNSNGNMTKLFGYETCCTENNKTLPAEFKKFWIN